MLRTALAATLASAAFFSAGAAEPARRNGFEIETLAPGVQVFRNVSRAPSSNSLVVERSDGLLVVGAQATPEAATALLAAVAKGTKKPVRYLVLTHPHAESCGGASAFPPGVLVVASDQAREKLADASYDTGGEVRARAGARDAWVEPPRVLPVLHADGPFTLDDPDRRVVIYPVRQSHSTGDLWVDVPGSGVMAVGGMVTGDRNPYAADGNVHNWIGALNELARDDLTALVPDTGRTLTPADVRQLRDALAWARLHVQMAFTDLVPREEIVGKVMADPEIGTKFDMQATPSFVRGLIDKVFKETLDDRKRRGMP